VKELNAKLASQGSTLDKYLQQRSIGEAALRRQIAWRLTWPKFLARYITPERLEAHFKAHRREFDGTELSVSHVLFRSQPKAGAETTAELIARAEAVRGEIAAGKTDFAEAARKHSAGPSGKDGGRLGSIARHGAMGETFSRAAFALQV